jgi:hypothetical protein
MKLPALAALLSIALLAQETPTERDAAREVLKKMDALEKSLDVPAWVERLSAPDVARDRVRRRVPRS